MARAGWSWKTCSSWSRRCVRERHARQHTRRVHNTRPAANPRRWPTPRPCRGRCRRCSTRVHALHAAAAPHTSPRTGAAGQLPLLRGDVWLFQGGPAPARSVARRGGRALVIPAAAGAQDSCPVQRSAVVAVGWLAAARAVAQRPAAVPCHTRTHHATRTGSDIDFALNGWVNDAATGRQLELHEWAPLEQQYLVRVCVCVCVCVLCRRCRARAVCGCCRWLAAARPSRLTPGRCWLIATCSLPRAQRRLCSCKSWRMRWRRRRWSWAG
jgi:hypothetical protein